MALDKVSNFAKTTITGIASGATEVVLGDATNFLDPASGEYNCVIWEISNYGNPADDPNKEIVRAISLSGSTLGITRAQESTLDVDHNTGGETYAIANVLTSKMITDIEIGKENSITYPTESPETKYYRGDKTFHEMVIGSGGFAGNVYPSEVDDAVISGYKQLSYTPDASETEKTIVVNNNTVTGLTAIYPDAVEVELIPAGTWRAVVYAKVSSTIGDTTMKLQVFKRTTGGVETDLFEMESETIENTADYALFRFESSQLGFATNTTDRLGARIKGATTRTSNTTITYIIGNGRGLYFNTTLPTRHDQLREKNGDDNFRHITTTEYNNISGAADVDSNGYLSSTDWGTFNSKQAALGYTAENAANKVTSFQATPDDTHYASEKLTKDSLDAKAPTASPTFTGTVTLPKTTEVNDTTGDHQYVLGVSELTADRTVTLPLLTGNDEFVFKDHTQTLTKKSIGGKLTLEENASIAHDPALSADGKYTGLTITGTAGATVAFGDLITLDKDDSRWELVDISVAAAATGDARGILGMAVSAGNDGDTITILLNGVIRADANFPTLTIGAAVYASTTGDVVVAQPSTTDYVIRIVGYGLTADSLYFNPENDWITHVA